MQCFVTGASGFIGKRLVDKVLSRPDATVCLLIRETSLAKADALRACRVSARPAGAA